MLQSHFTDDRSAESQTINTKHIKKHLTNIETSKKRGETQFYLLFYWEISGRVFLFIAVYFVSARNCIFMLY